MAGQIADATTDETMGARFFLDFPSSSQSAFSERWPAPGPGVTLYLPNQTSGAINRSRLSA
jgi:hypothetical protein